MTWTGKDQLFAKNHLVVAMMSTRAPKLASRGGMTRIRIARPLAARSAISRACMVSAFAIAVLAAPAAQAAPVAQAAPHPAQSASPPAASPPLRSAAPTTEQSMLRLAEIMGSLAWLRNLCGANDARQWRDRMTALIEAESAMPERKQRLAAAWNDGYRAWSVSHRRCTPSAELAIQRYLTEGANLTRGLSARVAR